MAFVDRADLIRVGGAVEGHIAARDGVHSPLGAEMPNGAVDACVLARILLVLSGFA